MINSIASAVVEQNEEIVLTTDSMEDISGAIKLNDSVVEDTSLITEEVSVNSKTIAALAEELTGIIEGVPKAAVLKIDGHKADNNVFEDENDMNAIEAS